MSLLDLSALATVPALKSIDLPLLLDVLEQEGGTWVGARVALVREPANFDYEALASLLSAPSDSFPLRLADALAHIQELGQERFDYHPRPFQVAARYWQATRELRRSAPSTLAKSAPAVAPPAARIAQGSAGLASSASSRASRSSRMRRRSASRSALASANSA